MSHPAASHADETLLMLGFALFMLGWLAFSLRTGEVYLRFRGTVERAKAPSLFWSLCALKLGLAIIGAIAFFFSLGRK
jgi:hypothetical protein